MIPYGKQHIDEDDINAVITTLKSEYLTQGPQVPHFEQALVKYCDSQYAVAVNSATSALHLACLALDVGAGDIVWTSPNSFVASANCAIYCGADVDFVDIDTSTGNLCVDSLRLKLIQAANNGVLPKVVIPVHFAGQPCEMEKISALAKQYNFKIIEDASHAIGATYQNKHIGRCEFSDICIFSFHPVKIITTMEGGVAMTNQEELAQKMRLLRSHGVTNNIDDFEGSSHGPWYYQQIALGYNYRMNDIEAALGISQLNKLDKFVAQRNEVAVQYDEYFEKIDNIRPLVTNTDVYSSYHLYVVRIRNLIASSKTELVQNMRNEGIFAHVHYIPIHLQPFYSKRGFDKGDFPKAEEYYQQAITLPLFPTLKTSKIKFIADTLSTLTSNL